MWTTTSQAAHLLLLSSAAAVHALPEIAITKHRHADVNPARLSKRQSGDSGGTVETNTYDVLTWSTGGAYYANGEFMWCLGGFCHDGVEKKESRLASDNSSVLTPITVTVGTPPQDQVVILDTGSSDLYFDSSSAATCQGDGPNSCRGGTFDHSKSSTYKVVAEAPAFDTAFGDGSTASGPFAEDTIGIGDVSIAGVEFGVADKVNSTTGFAVSLMGLGYSVNEASKRQYPNIPEVLATSGEIASRLYSVWLNDVDETSGTILFGGIDTSKYTGPLVTLNLLPTEVQVTDSNSELDLVLQFITTVTAMNATVDSQTSQIFTGGIDSVSAYGDNNIALPVLLDTGSSAWSIPSRYFSQGIAPLFPYVDFTHGGVCACKHRDSNDSISLEFGGKVTINVPARQFIVPAYDPQTNKPVYAGGEQVCAFMLVPAQDEGMNFQTLGDAVLRSMYVVFDLDNGQVSIAQSSLDSTAEPNVKAVEAGPDGVAKAAGASDTSLPANSYSIASPVSGSATFAASTGSSTIGVATGTDAVPADARPGASDSSSGGAGAASSSAAAVAGKRLGADSDLTALGSIWVLLCMVFGSAVVLLA